MEPNKQEHLASKPRLPRPWGIWLGPLIVFGGAISYFLYFVQFPSLRDTAWLNLLLVTLGLVISVRACWNTFTRTKRYRGKVAGTISLVLSAMLSGLFYTYIGILSYELPPQSTVAKGLNQAPDFALLDQHGQMRSLADFDGRRLILTFYRGHW